MPLENLPRIDMTTSGTHPITATAGNNVSILEILIFLENWFRGSSSPERKKKKKPKKKPQKKGTNNNEQSLLSARDVRVSRSREKKRRRSCGNLARPHRRAIMPALPSFPGISALPPPQPRLSWLENSMKIRLAWSLISGGYMQICR